MSHRKTFDSGKHSPELEKTSSINAHSSRTRSTLSSVNTQSTAQHSMFSDEGRAFLDVVDVDDVARTLLDVWLDTIDAL